MIALLRRFERAVTVVLVLGVSLALWEVAVDLLRPPKFILPAPSQVIAELANAPGFFARQCFFTLTTTITGFGLAIAIGVALAIGIVYSTILDRVLYTLLVTLNSLPKVALAPLFVIWMGTGVAPKIAIALTIAIFAIVIDTVLGLRSVDPEMIDLAKSSRASPLQILLKIRFPNALPSMFAGMKVGISFALVGAIVGEFVAGEVGLGNVILLSQGMFDTPRVFAALLLLGVLGTVLFFAVELVERLLLPWHVSQRGEHRANVTL